MARAQVTADVEAVLAGQHHVEHDQVPAGPAPDSAGLLSVVNDFDFVSFLAQVQLQAQGDVRIIFDNEDSGHGVTS